MSEIRVRPGELADYPLLAAIYHAASLSNDDVGRRPPSTSRSELNDARHNPVTM